MEQEGLIVVLSPPFSLHAIMYLSPLFTYSTGRGALLLPANNLDSCFHIRNVYK